MFSTFTMLAAVFAPTMLAAVFAPASAAPLKETAPPAPAPGGPAPINERFPTLDAYLAYLEKRSHMDGAWYREVRPGVYELQTGNLRLPDGGGRKRTFTREELEKKFGFAQ
jgi:hypothetical protein